MIVKRIRLVGHIIPIFFLMAFGLASCGEKIEKASTPPAIELRKTAVPVSGGQQYVSVTASAAWQIAISDGEGNADPEWISISPSSGEGSRDVTLTVKANTAAASRVAVLKVVSGGLSAETSLTQLGTDSDSDSDSVKNGGPISNGTKWLELPYIPSGTDAFTHTMTLESKEVRSYSFAWDYSNLVAPWVAYPLFEKNIGNTVNRKDRPDPWAKDPLLEDDEQPILINAYREGNAGWYARGHQIPSADRLTSQASNDLTFYGTNMTPQLNNDFNGTIWANLESKVRSWAGKSDTLYVVTGCVIDYKAGETVKYCLDNYGKKVTVPTAYYKVVLRYKTSSTIGYSDYSACAVWMEHKAYESRFVDKSYSMSVDALEEKLGIDFFVNLPSKVGEATAAKIEAEDPSKVDWWW